MGSLLYAQIGCMDVSMQMKPVPCSQNQFFLHNNDSGHTVLVKHPFHAT